MIKLKHFSITLGLLITAYLLWNRFIRVRLPRDVPFTFSEFSFIIICNLCVLLLYTLIVILFKKINNSIFYKAMLKALIDFHTFVVWESKLSTRLLSFQNNLILWLYNHLIFMKVFYIIAKTISICMCLLFAYEVLHIHHIKYFYYFSILLSIPMAYGYLWFSIQNIYDTYFRQIDEAYSFEFIESPEELDDDDDFLPESAYRAHMTLQQYIQEICCIKLKHPAYKHIVYLDETRNEYKEGTSICELRKQIRSTYKAKIRLELGLDVNTVFNIDTNNLEYKITICKNIFCIQYYVNQQGHPGHLEDHVKSHIDKNATLFIISIYLICWLYILIVSFHTLPEDSFTWLSNLIPEYVNPFNI